MTDTQYSEYTIKLLRYVSQRTIDQLRRGEEVPAYVIAQLLEELLARIDAVGESLENVLQDIACVRRVAEDVEGTLREVR